MTTKIIDDPTTLNELIHVHVFGGSVEPTTNTDTRKSFAGTMIGSKGRSNDSRWVDCTFELNGNAHVIAVEPTLYSIWNAWNDRHGKPYQADIEAHVAAYRGHIPDYVGSGDWLAKGIAKVASYEFGRIHISSVVGEHIVYIDNLIGVEYGRGEHADLSIAFWNAAIRACGYAD